MDTNTLKFIQDQVPEASEEEIQHAYHKCQGNVLEVLSFLMKIPEKVVPPKTAWEERRDVCDAYDGKIQEMLQQQIQMYRKEQEAAKQSAKEKVT